MMEPLEKQVLLARRRLLLQQFVERLPGCLFVTLCLAVVAIAVPKLTPLAVNAEIWAWSWLAGAAVVGIAAAAFWTAWKARSPLDAAVEIDRRFGLKERVSSMLTLDAQSLETEAGQALLQDARRRVERIDVKSEFGVSLNRFALLPLLPAALAFCLAAFLPNREFENEASASAAEAAQVQVKKSTEDLRRKLAEQRKTATEKGLKDAEQIFKKIEEGTRQLSDKKDTDRKKAMIKLNDLAKQLEDRRKALGGAEQLQKQLGQMKDLAKGPGDKLAKAMQNGDFNKAQEELKKLQDQLRDSKLSKEQKEQLAEQMQQMQQKLQQAADAHKQAMQDLQQQLDQAQKQGDGAQASKLQEQLDKLAQQMPQMNQMQQMAQQLNKAAQNLKQGSPQDAAQALDQISQNLQDMQQQIDEMEMLDQSLDQITQAKDSMNCQECQGGGCKACQGGGKQGQGKQFTKNGQGQGKRQGNQPGNGMGAGRGQGDRPEEKTNTGSYDSKVAQTPGKGKAVMTGLVDGPNIKGQVQQDVATGIEAARREASDPLTGENLPRVQREHAKEYFDLFLKEK